jgi:hypothetical protein
MFKKEFTKGLIVGIIIGAVLTFSILWYWDKYQRKTKFERNIEKIQKDTQRELDKAKKLFQ